MKPTELIARDVINGDTSEICRFINSVKIRSLALKIAFRCDREVAWQLLGSFLREFERIAMYLRKYDERVDDIAQNLKANTGDLSLNVRMTTIMEESARLKDELEKYHREIFKKKRRRCQKDKCSSSEIERLVG